MNRRDIIIVAVLINAGLLAALFVSSIKKEPGTHLVIHPKEAQQERAQNAKPVRVEWTSKKLLRRIGSAYPRPNVV